MKKYLLSIFLGAALVLPASAVILQTPTKIKTVPPMQGDGSSGKPVYAEVNAPNGLVQLDGLGNIPFEITSSSLVVTDRIVVGTGVIRSTITPLGFFGDGSGLFNLPAETESDPIFTAAEAFNITASSTTDWNIAFGWGNHALAGYADAFTVATDTTTLQSNIDGKVSRTGDTGMTGDYTTTGSVKGASMKIGLGTTQVYICTGATTMTGVLTIDSSQCEGSFEATQLYIK